MFKEFREFAMRGSVIDLAVGVIIGGAFGKITSSLVDDVVMPPLGLLIGRVDSSKLYVPLDGGSYASLAAARETGAPVLAYGSFINAVIQFILLAFAVFLMVKAINRMKREPAPPDVPVRKCPFCVSVIDEDATKCPACTSAL